MTTQHTPGPWVSDGPYVQVIHTPSVGNPFYKSVAETNCPLITPDEATANARLIAEAGTVASECGLSPRELLAQRDELLGALEEIVGNWDQGFGASNKAEDMARATIAKARGMK